MLAIFAKGGCPANFVSFIVINNKVYRSGLFKTHKRTESMVNLFERISKKK